MFRKSLAKYVGAIIDRRNDLKVDGVKQNLPVVLTTLINDTTGTLIASHYVNSQTKIACIFGTGCNAAYMEKVSEIDKIKSLGIDPDAEIAINCEWVGCFCVDRGRDD
jgi:hexokinase